MKGILPVLIFVQETSDCRQWVINGVSDCVLKGQLQQYDDYSDDDDVDVEIVVELITIMMTLSKMVMIIMLL